jgi:hypothetical protein
MKNILFPILLAFVCIPDSHAQVTSGNCFDEYYNLFSSRGAKIIPDGVQKIVVATKFEKSGAGNCFVGKVTVKNGEIVFPIYIEKTDGSFGEFKSEYTPAYKYVSSEKKRAIEDGMTITFRTKEDEFLKCFFVNFLEDMPKANKAAPSASSF